MSESKEHAVQVLSISELVKVAVTEAESLGQQAGEASSDVPKRVLLGRAAQVSLQVMPPRHSLLITYCTSRQQARPASLMVFVSLSLTLPRSVH